MRFAIVACVPAQLADALAIHGADVVSAAGRPGMNDEEALSAALARGRALITNDKDFGESTAVNRDRGCAAKHRR
jgi:predicted nuclease of predicted toxin-antitoxin system